MLNVSLASWYVFMYVCITCPRQIAILPGMMRLQQYFLQRSIAELAIIANLSPLDSTTIDYWQQTDFLPLHRRPQPQWPP